MTNRPTTDVDDQPLDGSDDDMMLRVAWWVVAALILAGYRANPGVQHHADVGDWAVKDATDLLARVPPVEVLRTLLRTEQG